MNEAANAKQQIVEKIKNSSTILVTVSTDPSVDELTAALGLTAMIGKLKKHATAVVSGAIPPAIEFLEPGKTFESTVDSLRDFIIALDKDKADHIRYKVDGDVVKIFVTPYRTTINEGDLEFSQGDYNVELVLALNVQDEGHLDSALEAHGRILHDATVATLSAGDTSSKLGSINWSEPQASSISEMLVSLSEALKGDKPLLDEQVSTAFLTGIVAATDRFSNNRTSSKVMTMAAQLMAAGANQQLIAAKLEEAHEIGPEAAEQAPAPEAKEQDQAPKEDAKDQAASDDGVLSISHELQGSVDEVADSVSRANGEAAASKAEQALSAQLAGVSNPPSGGAPSVADLQKDIAAAGKDVDEAAAADTPVDTTAVSDQDLSYEPSMGGTLNATTERAAEDSRQEELSSRNHTILSHNSAPLGDEPDRLNEAPFGASSAAPAPTSADDTTPADAKLPEIRPLTKAAPIEPPSPQQQEPAPAAAPEPAPAATPPTETLADLDKAHRAPHEEARAAVDAAFDAAPSPSDQPFNPFASSQPAPSDAATQPLQPQAPALAPEQAPGDTSSLPPLPDFTTLPPPPPSTDHSVFPPQHPDDINHVFQPSPGSDQQPQAPQQPPQPAPGPNDPNQFRIPGQS